MPSTHYLTPGELAEISAILDSTAKQIEAVADELESALSTAGLPGIPILSLPSLNNSVEFLEMLPARLRIGLLDLQSGLAAKRRKNADKATKPKKHRKSKR